MTLTAGLARLSLACLLGAGAEVLLWVGTPAHTPLEWGVRLLAYLVLACVVLDLAVRYRIRDAIDAMALLALYALCVGAFVAPQSTLTDLPRTLITRVLGGHGLVGLEMFGIWLAVMGAGSRRVGLVLLGAASWNGFYWGVWMRWMPELGNLFPPLGAYEWLFVIPFIACLPALVVAGALRVAPRLPDTDALLLPRVGWLGVLGWGFCLLILRGLEGTLTTGALLPLGLLGVLSWAVLWFRRQEKGETLLDNVLASAPLAWRWWLVAAACFALMSALAWALPLAGLPFLPQFNQLWLMEIGFGMVGALWYPAVAVAVAFRGVDEQLRKGEL